MTRLLVVNPGSTSTKFGVFKNGQAEFTKSIRHEDQFRELPDLISQLPIRKKMICDALVERGIDLGTLNAIVGRGGILHPLKAGVYQVNPDMIQDLETCRYGVHASNLGGLIAESIANMLGIEAYIADPVIVDEMDDLARYTGWPAFERKSMFHALNQKAVARRYAREYGSPYEDVKLIVAHLGGGVSVGAHRGGRVVDVNNALLGDGPFSAERTGGLPFGSVMDYSFSGHYTQEEMKRMFVGRGGLVAYLGTGDVIEIHDRIERGDEQARQVLEAMAYQVSKEIGAAAAVLEGDVDAIIITGGIAHDSYTIDWIRQRVSFIAPLVIYPGEDELTALAEIVGNALEGRFPINNYEKKAD